MRRILPLLTLIVFGVYSTYITVQHGYFGFLDLRHEPWGYQVLTDLLLACWICLAYVVPDAKARGINPVPYILGTIAFGSIALLTFLVHRNLVDAKRATST